MLEGELVEVNDAQSIYKNPQHDYTKRLWASMPKLYGKQAAREDAQ
jgi:peptide/nickel transport system ATP-binding protein